MDAQEIVHGRPQAARDLIVRPGEARETIGQPS